MQFKYLRSLFLLVVFIFTNLSVSALNREDCESGQRSGSGSESDGDRLSPSELRRRRPMVTGSRYAPNPEATLDDAAKCAVTACCCLTGACILLFRLRASDLASTGKFD